MLTLRPITPADNANVAHVIRTVMPEFSCVGEGFSINDPEVEDMAAAYAGDRSGFFVIEQSVGGPAGAGEGFRGTVVLGGAGFAPLTGGDPNTCELRKMYVLKEGRGFGGGKILMEACLEGARAAGYTQMYLETVTAMKDAAAVYKKYGFEPISWPMGDTGHGGCDVYMVREL
jgi:putative acetyltransferase